jgi:hypothetical protein
MRVRSGRRERSVPTSVQYQIERLTSHEVERDFPDDTPAATIEAWLREQDAAQERLLDEREDAIRASHGMKPRISTRPPTPPTAAENSADAVQRAYKAPALARQAPDWQKQHPDLHRDLREAAKRLEALTGEPVHQAPPQTETQAREMLRQLNASIYDLERGQRR